MNYIQRLLNTNNSVSKSSRKLFSTYSLPRRGNFANIKVKIPRKRHNHELIQAFEGLIVSGFNDTSILVGHFASSLREKEKRDKRNNRGDEREGRSRKRNRNESEDKKK